jgi:hypothetical protein
MLYICTTIKIAQGIIKKNMVEILYIGSIFFSLITVSFKNNRLLFNLLDIFN